MERNDAGLYDDAVSVFTDYANAHQLDADAMQEIAHSQNSAIQRLVDERIIAERPPAPEDDGEPTDATADAPEAASGDVTA